MKRIRFFLLLSVVALGILGLISCPTDNGVGGGGGGVLPGSITVSIDGGASVEYNGVAATYLTTDPPGPAVALDTLLGFGGGSIPLLLITFDGNTTGNGISVAWCQYQPDAIDTYATLTTGSVDITEYGAVGGNIVGTYTFTADAPGGGANEVLTGSFTAVRGADQ